MMAATCVRVVDLRVQQQRRGQRADHRAQRRQVKRQKQPPRRAHDVKQIGAKQQQRQRERHQLAGHDVVHARLRRHDAQIGQHHRDAQRQHRPADLGGPVERLLEPDATAPRPPRITLHSSHVVVGLRSVSAHRDLRPECAAIGRARQVLIGHHRSNRLAARHPAGTRPARRSTCPAAG